MVRLNTVPQGQALGITITVILGMVYRKITRVYHLSREYGEVCCERISLESHFAPNKFLSN